MKKVRTGNDIHIMWTITKNNAVLIDDEGLDLTGAEVLLIDTFKKPATFTYSINQIEENKVQVVGTFYGKDQKTQGKYNLLLVKNRGQENMITLDYVDAFILTCVSKFGVIEGTDESTVTVATIELESDYNVYNGSPDMINYYTKEEIDEMFLDYYTKTEVNDLLSLKADKTALQAHTGNSTIHVTANQKNLWNSVRDKASEDEVQALRQYTSAFQREITDEVATKANQSDLTAHTSNSDIHVTATDKTNWNNKQSALSYYKENTASGIVPLYTLKGAIEDTDNKMISGIFDRGQGVLLNGNVYYDLPSMKTVMNGILTNDDDGEGVILQMVQDGNALSGISINKDDVDVITNGEFNYNGYEVATKTDIPTSLSQLSDDATHRLVTDTEKTTWSAKQDNLPLGRGVGGNTLVIKTGNDKYDENIRADGNNSYTLSRGCFGSGTYSFNAGGFLSSAYLTNTDSTYTKYILKLSTSVTPFETVNNANSIFYYLGILRNAFVGMRFYNTSNFNYYGKIASIDSYNESTPYQFVFVMDKTGADEELTTASDKQVVMATNANTGNQSMTIGTRLFNTGLYNALIGYGDYAASDYNYLFGRGNYARGRYGAVYGINNIVTNFQNNNTSNVYSNVFGILNKIINTNGKQVFGFQNTVNSYYGEVSATTYLDTIVGNNNTIAARGVFVGETMNCPIKNSDQWRYMFGGFLNDNVNGKGAVTIVGQFNDTYSPNATWVLASGDRQNSIRHNSIEVLHDNNTFTTHIKDNVEIDGETHIKDDVEIDGAVTYADITKVEGATALVMNEPQHEVTDGIDIGGVTYYLDPNIIVKKGQIVIGDANYSGTYVALATVNNGEYTLISETLGEKLEVTYKATTDTVVLVYCDGTFQPDYVGITIYDTVESLSEKSDKAVTSSTSNLKIEVVSAMPQTPDANTIYIVV